MVRIRNRRKRAQFEEFQNNSDFIDLAYSLLNDTKRDSKLETPLTKILIKKINSSKNANKIDTSIEQKIKNQIHTLASLKIEEIKIKLDQFKIDNIDEFNKAIHDNLNDQRKNLIPKISKRKIPAKSSSFLDRFKIRR